MQSFWFLCRQEARLSLRQMGKLLNVSAHTYNAMEQGKINIPLEIVNMLYLIYKIDYSEKIDTQATLFKIQKQFASLEETERFYVAMQNLTGRGSYGSDYRKIRKVKNNILK